MQHHVDIATYRNEMEMVKAENETLRQQVRALERALRARRRDSSQSDASRMELGGGGGGRTAEPAAHYRHSRDMMLSPTMSGVTNPGSIAAWAAGGGGVGGVAGPRERSESQSTTASSRRGIQPEEEVVRVGESAASLVTGRGV